uniref:Bromo domain-containing protein n=1 Tax=Labrus bergylta TaxID=56723 RepID=A0A3Q3FVS8_9LABR
HIGRTQGGSEVDDGKYDLSLPEVCISTNSNSYEDDMNYEVQQAYRIFTGFLLDKHKGITGPFLHPVGHQEAQHGIGGVTGRGQAQLKQSMCLWRMEEKFVNQEYETITEFVADFRLMLENCYRYHGVDHWISKQAQKLEIMLEQKLTLLSRQRELEKKEAEEMSAKEVDEWEQTLLAQAALQTVDTLWELPAIGHFLCLAQTALNLPEIVFFELERCLLMPRCSLLLSKIMSSLLSPSQRRATLHRRPALPYRRWESELRQKVMGWYQAVGASHDQSARAEKLGLCHQFFSTLGEVSPLTEKPFHLLPFYQRVWLMKGLCDHVYETQKDVQDALLSQPIHECRESILGYDSRENAYIHFPHFCGADLRIYCQSPSTPPTVPFPLWVKRVEKEPAAESEESDEMKDEGVRSNRGCYGGTMDTGEYGDFGNGRGDLTQGHQKSSCLDNLKRKSSNLQSEDHCGGTSRQATQLSSESAQNSSEERVNDKIWTKKKKRKKTRGREQLPRVKGEHKQLQNVDRMRLSSAETAKSSVQQVATTIKRKEKKKKHKTGLVCTSLEELRELISRTEDELDDLESTKKRLGRWYYRREAVKDLHSTLIRLLNELSPWEPKLVKAYQRNRYSSLETKNVSKYLFFVLMFPASTREFLSESSGERTVIHQLKQPLDSTDSLLPKVHPGISNITSAHDSCQPLRSKLAPSNQSGDSASAARLPAQASLSPKPPILHPTTGLPKGYTPIPTLLAKSVGNKVTLMKHPTDLVRHTGMAIVTAALPKSSQANTTQTAPKSPVQVIYKVPEKLGQLIQKDGCSSPVKISVHPVMDHNTGEKIMQKVVILPSNLLIKNIADKASSLDHQQCKGIQVPVSKVAGPLCMSTNVPGFTIPENRIPVQQVAPLKDAKTVRTPSPSVSPNLQQGTPNTAGFNRAQICNAHASTTHVIPPKPSTNITPSSAGSPEPMKSTVPKQELRTVCIRDSQSILVTTRGGNTGIVKVQASSNKNAPGYLPSTPVITISPQFKAFLVSKTAQTPFTAPSQTSSCTVPAVTSVSWGQPQMQAPSVLKSPSSVTPPMFTAVTDSLPVMGSGSHNTGLDPVTSLNTITSCSAQLASYTSSSTSTKLQVLPSFPQSSSSTSTSATLPARNVINNDLGMFQNIMSCNSPAQVTTTVQSSPAQTSSVIHQPSTPTIGKESLSSSTDHKTQATLSLATTTNIPITTSAPDTIQQRIVIKTSTPLVAGTQILLNNARFVVPPQGLGPGSHVLIISSSSPQQVPTASATSFAASVPPQGVSHVPLAHQAPVLLQSPAKLSGVPALSSPFVACTPAIGPSLPATTSNVIPVQFKSQGLTLLHSKTNVVSALPRMPAMQAGSFASPPMGTPTLISSPQRLVSVPALVSPVVTSASVLGSALATIRLSTGTPVRAECSSTSAHTVAPTFARLSAPLSSFSLLPSSTAVPLTSSVITVPTTHSSAAGTPALHSSVPAQKMVSVSTPGLGIQPQHTIGIAASSTAQTQALAHTGLGNASIKKTVPAGMQPVHAGIRTQVLPTVAVPPIVSAVSRMQTLPIATVPPSGSTVSTFETLPGVNAPSSSTTVIISPSQTIYSLKTNNNIHPPVILTNQALVKNSLQTSSLGTHTGVSSKLLISPDGAVLNTVQGQVNPAELTTCPNPLDALAVSPNSSTGALHTHDSSFQPSQADRKCTN